MRPALAAAGIIFLGIAISINAKKPSLMESVMHLLFVDAANNIRNEPRDRQNVLKKYDFIIIGAGSAGCVLANRLSEIKKWNVLLIEAGGEENFLMDIPLIVNFWQFTEANWKYKSQPSPNYCLGMKNGQCHWPRGKVMGGSSILNYMIYTRGNKKDFDRWEELGNKGWNWDSVLPYFRKVEGRYLPNMARNKEFHPAKGHISVTKIPHRTPIADAFVEAGSYMGYPTRNLNDSNRIGFEYLEVSMINGSRCSSSRAYLHPVSARPNLHVKKRSFVTKIIIDPETKTATGVEFIHNRNKYIVYASKEIILSGGTVNSPHLLMLSGIGPAEHLKKKNIEVIQDAKVGYNMQDHYMPGGLTYIIDKPYTLMTQRIINNSDNLVEYFSFHKGPMSIPGGCEAIGLFNVDNETNKDVAPNLELLLISGSIPSEDSLYKNFNLDYDLYKEVYEPLRKEDTVMLFPVILTPKSRGRILLRDKNPFHHPLIYPNYFSDPDGHDLRIAVEGIKKSNMVMSMPPLKKLGTRLARTPIPSCKKYKFNTDEYWKCFSKHLTFTIYHPVGTCKMGPDSDPAAVVDERLRVRGIQHLRVVDASIMPLIPTAHTNAPTYMIAEKGSDMIKEDWGIETDSSFVPCTNKNLQRNY